MNSAPLETFVSLQKKRQRRLTARAYRKAGRDSHSRKINLKV
jgi:hypothetical protein